jgi:NADH:ubiquinone oxidoreductase subunit F (NADH-binding)
MAERGIQLGHGGLVALPEGFDPRGLLLHLLRFLSFESCGKCVPCRLGSTSALGLVERSGGASAREEFAELLEVIEQGSLCAFGQLAPGPMRTLLDRFGGRIFGGGDAP